MQDQSVPAAESLGEAARRARAQKMKSAAGAPKVYTDDKLSQLSSHGVSVVGDGNSSGGSSSGESPFVSSGANPGGETAPGGKNDEQYWRGRARAIHDQMAQCDQEISKLQDEIAKYGAVSVDPQSGAMQSIIYVNDRNAKIKQIEERKAGLQGQLDALEDEGRKAYQLLLDAMEESGYAAIAKITMHQREHIVVIRPREEGMTLHTMFYQSEIRAVAEFTQTHVEPKEAEKKLAMQLIDSLAAPFEPEKYRDEYQESMKALIAAKQRGQEVKATVHPTRAPVIDLMDALKKSLDAVSTKKKKPAKVEAAQPAAKRKRA